MGEEAMLGLLVMFTSPSLSPLAFLCRPMYTIPMIFSIRHSQKLHFNLMTCAFTTFFPPILHTIYFRWYLPLASFFEVRLNYTYKNSESFIEDRL